MTPHDRVVILDFGSQFTQLIARRVREAGVYSEIHPCTLSAEQVKAMGPKAIILSGGPSSVCDPDAPAFDQAILGLGLPTLGICYGMQLLAHTQGGQVARSLEREYGRAAFTPKGACALWDGLGDKARQYLALPHAPPPASS